MHFPDYTVEGDHEDKYLLSSQRLLRLKVHLTDFSLAGAELVPSDQVVEGRDALLCLQLDLLLAGQHLVRVLSHAPLNHLLIDDSVPVLDCLGVLC